MAGRAVTFNINSFREILKYYPAITNLEQLKISTKITQVVKEYLAKEQYS